MYPTQPNTNNSYQSNTNDSENHDFHDKIRENPRRTLAIIIGAIILIFTIIGLVLYGIFNRYDDATDQIPETAPIPAFEHRYLLEGSLGLNLSNSAMLDIGNVIVNNEELNSAPHENTNDVDNIYPVDLAEDSYRILDKNSSTPTYKIDLKTSDGRTYTFHARTDNSTYMITVLDRTDNDTMPDHVFIYTNAEDSSKDDLDKTATDWAKLLKLTDPIVKYSPFPAS